MQMMKRYAVYYAPAPGPFAAFAASWLGWDPVHCVPVPHPEVAGLPRALADITLSPRKYGFHGTVKAPFHLAAGHSFEALQIAMAAICGKLAPVALPGLELHRLGGFVALTPQGDGSDLARLAADVVVGLDGFRAPPSADEIARRNPDRLTPAQRDHLARWGYPYVMEEFQFHLTLTGDLPEAEAEKVEAILAPLINPLTPRPFVIDHLCLFGEAEDGRFRLLHRYALTG